MKKHGLELARMSGVTVDAGFAEVGEKRGFLGGHARWILFEL